MMRNQPQRVIDPIETDAPVGAMRQLGLWAGIAAACLLVAALATRTETGARRLGDAYAAITGTQQATEQQRRITLRERELELETRRLADAVMRLEDERERLSLRLAALERNYHDVTGSIGRLTQFPPKIWEQKASEPAAPAAKAHDGKPAEAKAPEPKAEPKPEAKAETRGPEPKAAETVAVESKPAVEAKPAEAKAAAETTVSATPAEAPAPSAVASAQAPGSDAAYREPMQGITARSQFGIDLGGGSTVSTLRASWGQLRRAHGRALEGLRPVVGVQEGKSGKVELRLVAGPISNAAKAARLCAALTAAGVQCLPTVFDGARLALR